MAANTQIVRMLHQQRARLESLVAKAEQSISGWKVQMDSLDGAISSLGGSGRRAIRQGAKGRKRGTWKQGSRGRPPQWFIDQQKAKGEQKPVKKSAKTKPAKRKKKVSKKQLAGLAKARAALAAKRAAQ